MRLIPYNPSIMSHICMFAFLIFHQYMTKFNLLFAVTCGPPTYVVENAALRPEDVRESYNYADWIYYACDYGYYRNGLNAIMCTDSGDWTNLDITCRRKL